MIKRIAWLMVSCVMVLSLVLTSCGSGEEEEEVISQGEEEETVITPGEKEEIVTTQDEQEGVETPEVGNWWDKFGEPTYGSTLNTIGSDVRTWDPYMCFGFFNPKVYEYPFYLVDWTLDREICSFTTASAPVKYRTGQLATSWESADMKTFTLHIRQGVHFHNKPPVNGRELDAYDLEWSYHRYTGLGSGFTEPSPIIMAGLAEIISIKATDKWTLVIEFSKPGYNHLWGELLDVAGLCVCPHEVYETYGSFNDWEHAIGTGPFILQDYTSGSMITWGKNPNYWDYDERHPENRLPYVDMWKELIISDRSTQMAALRTGKIDILGTIGWEQAEEIAKTNPELQQIILEGGGTSVEMRVDKEPFDDIRVRKAMQMAIDLPSIVETYFGGLTSKEPWGLVSSELPGYYTPFDEWPEEVKAGYIYNPEGARQLLAEAGYPDGFKTTILASRTYDLDLVQIILAYLAEIDVDVEMQIVEPTIYTNYAIAKKHTGLALSENVAMRFHPDGCLIRRSSTSPMFNYSCVSDPIYDEMYAKFQAATSEEECRVATREANDYIIAQQWCIATPPRPSITFYQHWLKGYSGEFLAVAFGPPTYARLFIDQELKKSME
jgi:peptide/nickel transport system substrate-binding protein